MAHGEGVVTTGPGSRVLVNSAVAVGPARRLGAPRDEMRLADAEARADHQLGFDQGYADGMRAAAAECEARLRETQAQWQAQAEAELHEALAAMADARSGYVRSMGQLDTEIAADRCWAEGLAVEAATHALTAVLGDMAPVDRVAGSVGQAMASGDLPAQCIRVAESDTSWLTTPNQALEVVVDPSLRPGECILAFATGELDVGLPTRLRQVVEGFILALGDRRHDAAR